MNKKQLAEMIKHLRNQRKIKMEQLGGMGKFNPVHSPDPYQPKGDTPNAYAHRKNVQEIVSTTIQSGLGGKHNPRRAAFSSKLGNLGARSGWQTATSNQKRNPGIYGNTPKGMAEAEEDMGPTKTGQKGKRQEKINLEPKQSDERIF